MPIVINDDNTVVSVNASGKTAKVADIYTPKFFHKTILTGKGGNSRGILNEKNDPKMFPNGYKIQAHGHSRYGTSYSHDIKTYNIPTALITSRAWNYIKTFERPDIAEMTLIGTSAHGKLYLTAPLSGIVIDEYQAPVVVNGVQSSATVKELGASMNILVFYIADKDTSSIHENVSTWQEMKAHFDKNTMIQSNTSDIFATLRNLPNTFEPEFTMDRNAMNDFVTNYSLYKELCKASERWQTQAAYYIADVLIKNAWDDYNKNKNSYSDTFVNDKPEISFVLSELEKYSIPLAQYQDMYDRMSKILPADALTQICKVNLNLQLANTLKSMNGKRASLPNCPCNNHITGAVPFSNEQFSAIESTSPLVLVQSGAGSGKSTVILGRIDHMIANGIDPNDITVLSFTNAAANHIKDLKPNVHSMTIASMMHTIYSANFPNQQLSSLSTILNSLDIYFNRTTAAALYNKHASFIESFRLKLERLRDNNEYTAINNFIEDHLDETIEVLDIIGQTSLELESIICYQKIETLVEPEETKTKHLIIDEVQDNSISEFIYSIKYVDTHLCSMYIVGDCSQTLYEFRASNPTALNILESSGVFETHKLQTNYRSNQEILDFANILLGNIQANQYANIQLRANSLAPVTTASFKEAVGLTYSRLPNKSGPTLDGMLTHSVQFELKDYIDTKLKNNEQICILAYQRRNLSIVEKQLRLDYPNAKIASLVPRRQFDSTIFSKMIATYWDRIRFAPPTHFWDTVKTMMFNNILTLKPRNSNVQIYQTEMSKLIDAFEQQYGNTLLDWENQVIASVMPESEFLEEVKKLMIEFEIKRNAVAQKLLSSKNAEAKKSEDVEKADFVLSTIHSAKGLEFENVIIYYGVDPETTLEEATKRMYYVALTRAKKSEFIFAYGTMARPKILGDYERTIKSLMAKDAKLAKQNANPADDSDGDNNSNTVMTADPEDLTDPEITVETPAVTNEVIPLNMIPHGWNGTEFSEEDRIALSEGKGVYRENITMPDGSIETGMLTARKGPFGILFEMLDN